MDKKQSSWQGAILLLAVYRMYRDRHRRSKNAGPSRRKRHYRTLTPREEQAKEKGQK